MTTPLLIGKPQMDIDEAVSIMFKRKVKKLSVVEHGNLIGLVTLSDIIRSANVIAGIKKLNQKPPLRIQKIINTYFDVESFGKKCPLIVEHGYIKKCREIECMWWFGNECVITKLTKQLSDLKNAFQLSPL